MQGNIDTMKNDIFCDSNEQEEIVGVGKNILGDGNADGYLEYSGNLAYAYTTPKNFITGLSDITYAPI